MTCFAKRVNMQNYRASDTSAPALSAEPEPPLIAINGGKITAQKDYFESGEGKPGYLLLYTVSGTGELVRNKLHQQIEEGEAVLIDRKTKHEYFPTVDCDGSWVFCYVHFDGSGAAYYANIICTDEMRKVQVRDKTNLTAYLDKLFITLRSRDSYRQCIQAETLCRILTLLAAETLAGGRNEKINTTHIETINTIADYIKKNHWQPLALDGLAKMAGMSKYHFLRVFKEIVGTTPHKYMLMHRIEAAKKILTTSEVSVFEVSIMVGFKDEGHFSRSFKNITQTTPIQYKKLSK